MIWYEHRTAALDPAVIAHIRHNHTRYDALLMGGVDRSDAHAQVRGESAQVLASWKE